MTKRTSFAVYALSRGQGVPELTRAALNRARAVLQEAHHGGVVVRLVEQRIGLEGETRLCAEFQDDLAAGEVLAQLKTLTRGVELLNLVVEPCGDSGGE
jgi:hypothetical protein